VTTTTFPANSPAIDAGSLRVDDCGPAPTLRRRPYRNESVTAVTVGPAHIRECEAPEIRMEQTMIRVLTGAGLLTLAGAAHAGTSVPNGTSYQGTSLNGIWQNGVSPNGLWQNGVWSNGTYVNGTYLNGPYLNGWRLNGTTYQGMSRNGVRVNGTQMQ